MITISAEFTDIPGTEAALGQAGGHTLVADRPQGTAGGSGLGFNGGQLLALAIGGCYCNDLRYVAHGMGVALNRIAVRVTLELQEQPLLVHAARIAVDCETTDDCDPQPIINQATATSTISNSLIRGIPVTVIGTN